MPATQTHMRHGVGQVDVAEERHRDADGGTVHGRHGELREVLQSTHEGGGGRVLHLHAGGWVGLGVDELCEHLRC